MKKCEHCGVNVNTNFNTCPLCFKELIEGEGEVNEIFKPREKLLNKKNKTPKSTLYKIFLFLSVIAIVVTVVINLMVKPWPLWSLLVVVGIIYVWVLISHTIISKRSIFEKLLLQIGIIIALLFICEWIAGGEKWMIDYVIPSISIAVITVLFILSVSLKNHRGLLAFFIMTLILTILSSILLLCNILSFNLLNIITIIIGGVAMLGSLLFNGRALKTEFSKKFHI